MRKIWFILILTSLFIATVISIYSCKHEILYPKNYGYNGTPYVINNPPLPPPPPTGHPCSPDTVYFDNQILPILVSNCTMCHNTSGGEENFSLTSYNSVMYSGTVSPGNPGSSRLYNAITRTGGGEDNERMPPPPRSPLTQPMIDLIYKWIVQGAKYLKCGSCDTTKYTFSGAIFPVIQNNCLGCHSGSNPGGGVSLATYNDIIVVVNNGKLMGGITGASGYSPMPKGGYMLSSCVITQFKKWIKNGSPNN